MMQLDWVLLLTKEFQTVVLQDLGRIVYFPLNIKMWNTLSAHMLTPLLRGVQQRLTVLVMFSQISGEIVMTLAQLPVRLRPLA